MLAKNNRMLKSLMSALQRLMIKRKLSANKTDLDELIVLTE
jgi:hypothetical protein